MKSSIVRLLVAAIVLLVAGGVICDAAAYTVSCPDASFNGTGVQKYVQLGDRWNLNLGDLEIAYTVDMSALVPSAQSTVWTSLGVANVLPDERAWLSSSVNTTYYKNIMAGWNGEERSPDAGSYLRLSDPSTPSVYDIVLHFSRTGENAALLTGYVNGDRIEGDVAFTGDLAQLGIFYEYSSSAADPVHGDVTICRVVASGARAAVPEPSSMLLLGSGLCGLLGLLRKRG